MGLPAESGSGNNSLARMFGVSEPTLLALFAELDSSRAGAMRADLVALRLGLSSRFTLARLLKRYNLPCLTELKACFRVLRWIRRWEAETVPLARQALHDGQDPAIWYRTVRRVTGRSWSEVRQRGRPAVLEEWRQRYGRGSES